LPLLGRRFPLSFDSMWASSLLASIALLKASASSYPASLLFNVDRLFEVVVVVVVAAAVVVVVEDPRPFLVSFSLVGERIVSLLREADRDEARACRFKGR